MGRPLHYKQYGKHVRIEGYTHNKAVEPTG